jgi:hypothetical protein
MQVKTILDQIKIIFLKKWSWSKIIFKIILHVFNTILYENEFQNPQIFQQTISLFPEQSTLYIDIAIRVGV